jgi:hypothetical protein
LEDRIIQLRRARPIRVELAARHYGRNLQGCGEALEVGALEPSFAAADGKRELL